MKQVIKWFNCAKVCGKCIKVNDLSGSQRSVNKNIRFKSSMVRSGLCYYSDYVVKGTIDLLTTDANDNDKSEKMGCEVELDLLRERDCFNRKS